MTTSDDLNRLDALGLAQLVRQKDVKPIELVDAAIKRIERVNPTLNAVVTPMYEHAREAALRPTDLRPAGLVDRQGSRQARRRGHHPPPRVQARLRRGASQALERQPPRVQEHLRH